MTLNLTFKFSNDADVYNFTAKYFPIFSVHTCIIPKNVKLFLYELFRANTTKETVWNWKVSPVVWKVSSINPGNNQTVVLIITITISSNPNPNPVRLQEIAMDCLSTV